MKDVKSLRLLDIPVTWPPDSQRFVSYRLEALAKAGLNIQIVTSFPGLVDSSQSPHAEIIRISHSAEPRNVWVLRALTSTVKLALRSPRRFLSFLTIGWRYTRSATLLLRWWLLNIPLSSAAPDIIHFEWNNAAVDYRWLPEFLNCPYVVSCRGRQINILPHLDSSAPFVLQLSASLQGAAAIHGVSRHILEEAIGLGADPARCHVVYTSADMEFFVPRPPTNIRPDGPLRVITIGICIWRKGYEYLLSALKMLLDTKLNVELAIVDWGGEERDRVDYTIADLGLAEYVTVLDRMSREQIRKALWDSDVCILSALSEGISNSVIEAMACGIPVVTTDCGGMREAVTDGVEGFVVPTRSPKSLADALAKLAEDSDLRRKMGIAGRSRALAQFSPDNQARHFLRVYEQALGASVPKST